MRPKITRLIGLTAFFLDKGVHATFEGCVQGVLAGVSGGKSIMPLLPFLRIVREIGIEVRIVRGGKSIVALLPFLRIEEVSWNCKQCKFVREKLKTVFTQSQSIRNPCSLHA
jgi:hypothetical protein